MNKKFFLLFLVAYLVFACTAHLPTSEDQPPKPQAESTELLPQPEGKSTIMDLFGKTPKKDEELFNQGLRQIVDKPNNEADYGTARETFETLLNSYPESKWHDFASIILRLLEELDLYHNRLFSEQAISNKISNDKTKMAQEMELLKKELRRLNEKYQAETASLQQENDQLKKDIQLLKNLEIQLDRREKQLR